MKDEQILCAALLTGGAETAPRNLNTGEIALTDRGDDTCDILVPTLRVGTHIWDALRRKDPQAQHTPSRRGASKHAFPRGAWERDLRWLSSTYRYFTVSPHATFENVGQESVAPPRSLGRLANWWRRDYPSWPPLRKGGKGVGIKPSRRCELVVPRTEQRRIIKARASVARSMSSMETPVALGVMACILRFHKDSLNGLASDRKTIAR